MPFQTQQSPFSFGIQEGADPRHQPFGVASTVENCRWTKSGQLSKRDGTSAVARSILGGGTLSSMSRLGVRGSELFAVSGQYLYSYESGQSAWGRKGYVPDLSTSWRTLVDRAEGVYSSSCAISGTTLFYAWQTGDPLTSGGAGPIYCAAVDTVSGGTLIAPVSQAPGTNANGVKVVIIGTSAFVVYRVGANIQCDVYNLTTLTVTSSANTLRNDAANATLTSFDAIAIGSNLVLAYETTGGALKLYSYNTSLVQQATGGITGEVNSGFRSISIDQSGTEDIWVGYFTFSGGLIRLATANYSTLAQVAAPVTIDAMANADQVGLRRMDATHCIFAYSSSTSPANMWSWYCTTAGKVTDTGRRSVGGWLASKPFIVGSSAYAIMCELPSPSYSATTFPAQTHVVELRTDTVGAAGNLPPHRYISKIDDLVGAPAGRYSLPATATSGSTVYALSPYMATVNAKMTNLRVGLRVVTVNPASSGADMWRSVQYGQEAYLGGATLAAYDGRSTFDYAFSRPSAFYNLTTAGAGVMLAGNYIYQTCREYRSASGVLHRSPTSEQVTVATGANGQNTLVFINDGISAKIDDKAVSGSFLYAYHALYRSTQNGTSLYRLSFEPSYNTVTDVFTGTTNTLTDNNPDTNIGGSVALNTRPLVYTTGGILDDEQPPSLSTVCLHKQRLWGVDGSGNQVWFSKSFLDDYGVAPGFSTSFRIQFDVPVTALASMEDKLIAYASDRLWYVLGGDDIPPNGISSDLQGPFPIPSDVGCTNPRSVVSTPDGQMFQSSRGIFLLGRGLEVVWIGRPVKDQLAAYPYITSAVLVAYKSEVRFTANSGANNTGNGIVLIYNYVEKQWSTAKYTCGAAGYGGPIADAIMWNGVWTFCTPDGYVYKEDSTTHLDSGTTWVPMTIETAWISAAGPLAYHSVRSFQLEGVSNTNHDLTISVYTDGVTTPRQTKTFQAGTPALAIGPLEQCEVTVGPHRRCQHIKFKIQDATPSNPTAYPVGTGQGATFDAMGIEFRVQPGFAVNPASKKG